MTFRQAIATRLARLLTAGGAAAVLLLPAILAAHTAIAHAPSASTDSIAVVSHGDWPDEAPRHDPVRCDLCIAFGTLHVPPTLANAQPVLAAPEAGRLTPADEVVGTSERLILCRPRAPPVADAFC